MSGTETLVWVHAVENDAHGDPVAPTEAETTTPGCVVYPRYSTEADGRQGTTITGYTALVYDLAANIKKTDECRWRGGLYKVEGKPGQWRFLDGTDAALEIALVEAVD